MLQIDHYASLNSPIHRLNLRVKLIGLFVLMIAMATVRELWLLPFMLGVSAGIYALSRLPLAFLLKRLRYPGLFVLAMVVFLPFFTGETVLYQLGFLSLTVEGLQQMLLVVARFVSIMILAVVMFATASFVDTLKALKTIGIPQTLADLLLLTVRYLYELSDSLNKMQRAMRLRGFKAHRFNRHSLRGFGSLLGSLLIRSFETSERVYQTMRLRGYGAYRQDKDTAMSAEKPRGILKLEQAVEQALALEVKDLSFAYDSQRIIEKLSFGIKAGERVGLIGPNGAGKSSLFMLLTGLLAAQEGHIRIFGKTLKPQTFREDIGLVFQNPSDQLFCLSVAEDIAFGPQNLGLGQTEINNRVEQAMQLTATSELASTAPHHLSGGQKRMVAIATILAMHPQLVLYDEPDANLDMRSRRRLISFLQQAPHTLILASHDLEMILEVCDRVILLDDGCIIADGRPDEVMRNATLMEAHGLEKPHSLVPHVHHMAM